MRNFYWDKTKELDEQSILKIVQDFTTSIQPELNKRYNYYSGKHKILNKVAYTYNKKGDKIVDTTKKYNKVVVNFVKDIVNQYSGYAVGKPVSYSHDGEDIDILLDTFNYNDINNADMSLLKNALIFGRAAEICYVDEESKVRFTSEDIRHIIPIYTDDLNQELLYVIRLYSNQLTKSDIGEYYIELYSNDTLKIYKSTPGWTSLNIIENKQHNFSQVPITIFKLNDEEEAIAENIFSLQDAYNTLYSDSIDNWDAFVDAYLVLTGVTADQDDLDNMKRNRVLILPESDCKADYLQKDASMSEITFLLEKTEEKIRVLSACPDFTDEQFGASSGVALRYKLLGFENRTAEFMTGFKKALQRRIELLADILIKLEGEELWRDIKIEFTRNLPDDLAGLATELNSFRGLVSDRTLLQQIPFVQNADEELKATQEEREKNMELYQNDIDHEDNLNE